MWFDPSSGGFWAGGPPTSPTGTTSNFFGGAYYWVGTALAGQPGFQCFSTSLTPPGPGFIPVPIDPNNPPDLSNFVPCPGSSAGGGGGEIIPPGLGGGGGAGGGGGGGVIGGQQPGQPGATCDNPLFVQICGQELPPPTPLQTGEVPPGTGVIVNAPGNPGAFFISPAGNTCAAIDSFLATLPSNSTVISGLTTVGVIPTPEPDWFQSIGSSLLGIPFVGDALKLLFPSIWQAVSRPLDALTIIGTRILSTFGCSIAGANMIRAATAYIGWAERVTAADYSDLRQALDNWRNYMCPMRPPSIADANVAFRTGDIDLSTWRCWVRMNGLHEQDAGPVYHAQRLQLTPDQVIRLWRRKYFNDQQTRNKLGQIGILDDVDATGLNIVSQWVPPPSDLLHFIVRGIGDPNLVASFHLLDEFDTLYQGKLVDWGEANGIAKETMEAYHAAHWVVPAPGQLFTMLQRLREDNIPAGTDPADWTTNKQDLNRALRENAYAPFWRPRLEAISYVPMGWRQINKLYTEGQMKRKEAITHLRDLGYNEQTAKEIAKELDLLRRDFLRRHPDIKLYMDAALNRNSAIKRLTDEGFEQIEAIETLKWADNEALDKSRFECIKGLKKRFECGEFDAQQVAKELSDLILDQDQIVRLRTTWECEQKTCGKHVAASQLCSWADNGLITPQEYLDRLKKVGYSDDDANRIVAECNIKLSTRQLAARERALKQALAQLQRDQNRQSAADRRAVADARREANLIARLQREAARAQARADRQAQQAQDRASRSQRTARHIASQQTQKIKAAEVRLLKAADMWAELKSIPAEQAGAELKAAVEHAIANSGASSDLGIRAAIQTVLAAKKESPASLDVAVLDHVRVLQAYAALATAAVCEQGDHACPSHESNGNTSDQGATT